MYRKLKVQTGGIDRIGNITVWVAGDKAMRRSS